MFVETGISNDAYIEIKTGITEGTTVEMAESTTSSNSFMNFGGGFGERNQNSQRGGNMEFPSGMQMPSGGMPSGAMPGMP